MSTDITVRQSSASRRRTARSVFLPLLLVVSTTSTGRRDAVARVASNDSPAHATDSSIAHKLTRNDPCSTRSAERVCALSRAKLPVARGLSGAEAPGDGQPSRAILTAAKERFATQPAVETFAIALRFRPRDELLDDVARNELSKRIREFTSEYRPGARMTILALPDTSAVERGTSCDDSSPAPRTDGCVVSCDAGRRPLLIRRACTVRLFFNEKSPENFWEKISTAIAPALTPTPAATSKLDVPPRKPHAEPPLTTRDGPLIRFKLRIMAPLH